jgi:hypothetical protein
MRLGHFTEAESLLRLCLENACKLTGPGHINTAKIQFQLASLLIQTAPDNPIEARDLLTQSLVSRHRVFGPDSRETNQVREALERIGSFPMVHVSNSAEIPAQHAMRN